MRRELKKQIKQDELVTGVERVARWLGAHHGEARTAAIVLVLLAAGTAGFSYWRSHRAEEAEREFGAALEVFEAPVRGELPDGAALPPGPIYPSAAEKYRKAMAAFDGVERRFGSTHLGLRARYYSALCRVETGDFKEAERLLGDVAGRKQGRAIEPALARLALAGLHRRSGQKDKAVEAYRQIAEDPGWPLPKDHVLMSLASTLEEAARASEARRSYQRVVDEFPGSVYSAEARRRAEYLATSG
jgi:hypothetical protein